MAKILGPDEEALREQLIAWVDVYKKRKGIRTQAQLAEFLGVSRAQVTNAFSRGVAKPNLPSAPVLKKLLDLLGLDLTMAFSRMPDQLDSPKAPSTPQAHRSGPAASGGGFYPERKSRAR